MEGDFAEGSRADRGPSRLRSLSKQTSTYRVAVDLCQRTVIMPTQLAENTPFPNSRGHQGATISPRTSSSTCVRVPPAQKINTSSIWIHGPTTITPEPGPVPENTKSRKRVDSGVSLSSITSLLKTHLHHSKASPRSETIASKSSACSTANTTVSSTSTSPEEPTAPEEPKTPPKKVKFAVEAETRREKLDREARARHKVIDDQVRAHREKERARNQRAEEMFRVRRQHKRVSEAKLRQAVRENELSGKGTRMERFRRWARGVFTDGHERNS